MLTCICTTLKYLADAVKTLSHLLLIIKRSAINLRLEDYQNDVIIRLKHMKCDLTNLKKSNL